MSTIQRINFSFLFFSILFLLSGCGGGGGETTTTPTPLPVVEDVVYTPSTELGIATANDNINILDSDDVPEIVSLISDESGSGVLTVKKDKTGPEHWKKDDIIILPPSDLLNTGMALKIDSVTEVDEQYQVSFSLPSIEEIIGEADIEIDSAITAGMIQEIHLFDSSSISNTSKASSNITRTAKNNDSGYTWLGNFGSVSVTTKNGIPKAGEDQVSVEVDEITFALNGLEIVKTSDKFAQKQEKVVINGEIKLKDLFLFIGIKKDKVTELKMGSKLSYIDERSISVVAKIEMAKNLTDVVTEDKVCGSTYKKKILGVELKVSGAPWPKEVCVGGITFAPGVVKVISGNGNSVSLPISLDVFFTLNASLNVNVNAKFTLDKRTQKNMGVLVDLGKDNFDDKFTLVNTSYDQTHFEQTGEKIPSKWNLTVEGKAKGEVSVGLGFAAALNVGGIYPVVTRLYGGLRADAEVKTEFSTTEDPLGGCYNISANDYLGYSASIGLKVQLETPKTSRWFAKKFGGGFSYNWEDKKEHFIFKYDSCLPEGYSIDYDINDNTDQLNIDSLTVTHEKTGSTTTVEPVSAMWMVYENGLLIGTYNGLSPSIPLPAGNYVLVLEVTLPDDKKAKIIKEVEVLAGFSVSDVFPDQNLAQCVSEYMSQNNYTSASQLTYLRCDYKNIQDTTGIEELSNLEVLTFYENDINTIDVSQNLKLTDLGLSGNNIQSIDVQNNSDLSFIEARAMGITSIDFSNNNQLVWIELSDNKLNSIDVSHMGKLNYLGVDENNISQLNLKNSPKFEVLSATNNRLTTLNTDNNPELTGLSINTNGTTSLDLRNNPKLEWLYTGFNQLSSLDISNNKQLQILEVRDNKLSSLNTSNHTELVYLYLPSNNISSINVDNALNLKELNISKNNISRLDVRNNKKLTQLQATEANLSQLDITNNSKLWNLHLGRNNLSSLDISANNLLETFSIDDNPLSNLNVTHLSSLKHLYIGETNLTNIDVSKNTKLEGLYTKDSKISGLDVSNNQELKMLSVGGSYQSTINISNNNKLEHLSVTDTSLQSIDISNNPLLKTLRAWHNKLNSIDLRKNTLLEEVHLHVNQLERINIENNTSLLYLDVGNNPLTVETIDYLKARNGKNGLNIVFDDKPPQTLITDLYFSDANMSACVNSWSQENAWSYVNEVTSLYCSNKQITSTSGIENFINLTQLDLPLNQLSNIDLSHFNQLERLNVFRNELTNINLSNLQNLKFLSASDNDLATIDLNQNRQLEELNLSRNKLTIINLDNNNDLLSADLRYNLFTQATLDYLTNLNGKNGLVILY